MTTYKQALAAGVLVAVGLCGGTAWVARSAAMPDDAPKPVAKAAEAPAKAPELPEGATARMGSSQFRHGEAVFFIAYTPDGKHVVTAGRDHAVKLWDRATGKAVRSFELAAKKPAVAPKAMPADSPMTGKMMMMRGAVAEDYPLALSHDGKHLVAGRGETITIWDVATGKTLRELTTKGSVFELAYTPDGKLIASDASREVTLWDAANGRLVKTFKVPAPEEAPGTLRNGIAVSPAGTHVAQQFIDGAAGNAVLRITELTTGKAAEDIKMGVGGAQAITFSPDGKYLAWSAFTEGVVVWDLAANKELTSFAKGEGRPRFFGNSICFTDDGKTLAVTLANDAIELWDVAGAKLLRTLGGHDTPRSNRVAVRLVVGASDRMTRSDLAFSRDGKTVGGSLGNATVRQYDTETGKEISPSAGHLSGVIAVGTDGRNAVSVSKESVRVWDAAGREVRQWALAPPAVAAAVTPDAKRVATATGGGAVQLWDAATGEKARTIETKRADVAGLGFSPDGKLLATKAELNSAVNLWDVATGAHVRTIGQDGEPVINGGRVSIDAAGAQTPAVTFSPDGRVIAAVGDRKQVGLWDAASGVLLGEIAAPAVAFAFSASGHVLAVLSNRGVVAGYEVATGEKRYEFKPSGAAPSPIQGSPGGGAFSITAFTRGNASGGGVGFSADGRFVVAGAGGPALWVWDTLTGQEVAAWKGHQGSVSVVRTAPNGRSLVSGSVDTTAMAWNLDHLPRVDLTRDAPMPGADLEALWADLAKPDPVAAATATRKLLTERSQAVALLKDRLRPVPAADEARVAKLIADLGGSFDARRKATAELEQLGGLAAEALRAALEKNPPLDLKQRIDKLLEKATVQKPQGDRLRELRAVELLELAATPEARQVLDALAKGAPGARLTREAQAAAARMGDQSK